MTLLGSIAILLIGIDITNTSTDAFQSSSASFHLHTRITNDEQVTGKGQLTLTSNHPSSSHLYLHSNSNSNSNLKQEKNSQTFSLTSSLKKTCSLLSILSILLLETYTNPVLASDYGSLTTEQKAVAEAWRIVDNNYIDRTFNNQDWFQMRQSITKQKYKSMDDASSTIDSMVASLGDKYTRYLPPAKYRSIVDSATGTLAGIGVELSYADPIKMDRVIAADIEPNSPASNGGLQPKDIFLEVNGVRMDDGKTTPDDVASQLRGREGTKVGVVVERNGKVQDFILTRKPITITSVRTYLSKSGKGNGIDKVGVIRIKSFSGTTAQTVSDALSDLKNQGAKSFVLDLRGNPGGLLPGGTDTASLFLESNKPLVFVVDKKGIVDAQSTYTNGKELDTPLVIYVNGNTASAAEVLTAALKENQRAIVVGEQTFGKGIIQTIRQLSYDNGGVAVTVARYETPNHNNINKQGISVDIPIKECENEDAVVCIPASAFVKPSA